MRTVLEYLPHDLAVLSAIQTIGPADLGRAPANALNDRGQVVADYLIVYPINVTRDGSNADPYADAWFDYQVTVVGRLPAGVRDRVSQIEPALLTVSIPDRTVMHVEPIGGSRIDIDRDVGPPHPYFATPIFRLSTTPGGSP